jgi:opacity protein-like surface antigen
MMWRVFVLGTAVAALTLTFGSAASGEEGHQVDFNRRGGYVQATGVYSWANYGSGLNGGPTGGFDVRLGSRFTRWVSAEMQYEFLSQRGVSATNAVAMQQLGVWKTETFTHTLTFNFRAYPLASLDGILGGRIQPYALAGVGFRVYDTPSGDGLGFAPRFGLGFDFYLAEHWALTLEGSYMLATGGSAARTTPAGVTPVGYLPIDNLDHVSAALGVTYRF